MGKNKEEKVLKKLRLKLEDGTLSTVYKIGANAENIDIDDKEDLIQRLERIDNDIKNSNSKAAEATTIADVAKATTEEFVSYMQDADKIKESVNTVTQIGNKVKVLEENKFNVDTSTDDNGVTTVSFKEGESEVAKINVSPVTTKSEVVNNITVKENVLTVTKADGTSKDLEVGSKIAVVNNVTSDSTTDALSAAQGKAIQSSVSTLNNSVNTLKNTVSSLKTLNTSNLVMETYDFTATVHGGNYNAAGFTKYKSGYFPIGLVGVLPNNDLPSGCNYRAVFDGARITYQGNGQVNYAVGIHGGSSEAAMNGRSGKLSILWMKV